MKRTLIATILFISLLLSSGVWIWLTRYIPPGVLRDIVIPTVGVFVAAIFVALLVVRVRLLLRNESNSNIDVFFGVVEFCLFVGTFAWMHTELGLQSATDPTAPVIHSFPESFYFTILNFTSLGAEDLITTPDSRFLVAIESFVGYLLLATIAATIVTLIGRSRPITNSARHAMEDRQDGAPAPPKDTPGD